MQKRLIHAAMICVLLSVVLYVLAFSMEFACFFYEVTLGFWLLKTFFCVFLILDFITEDRLPLRPAGLLLIIICVANSPYQLPGNWAFVQWFTAKVAMVALAVELYCVDMELSKNQ